MGLTFAPEAGSDRMRRVINKQLTEQEILDTFAEVFRKGWLSVKLYFMVGLPTETKEDIEAIGQLVDKIRDQARKNSGKTPQFPVNASHFCTQGAHAVPWFGQNAEEELAAKHEILGAAMQRRGAGLFLGQRQGQFTGGSLVLGRPPPGPGCLPRLAIGRRFRCLG